LPLALLSMRYWAHLDLYPAKEIPSKALTLHLELLFNDFRLHAYHLDFFQNEDPAR